MKDLETAIELADSFVLANTGKHLNDLQIVVLRESWQGKGKTYDQIARDNGYSANYIKQGVAPKLWKLLSKALGEKVSKSNFRSVISRQELVSALKQRLEPYKAGRVPSQTIAKRPLDRETAPAVISWRVSPPQGVNPRELELPTGRVPLKSPFYIERSPHDRQCYQTLVRPGAFLRLEAPAGMGKSSLMVRILAYAATLGYKTAYLNLQQADRAILANLDRFLQWVCRQVSWKLAIEPKLESYWDEALGSKGSCTRYFQDYLLPQLDAPFVLAVDELERIFEFPDIAPDVLLLLRSWYEEGKDAEIWQTLRQVVATSTEVWATSSLDRFPFYVGLPIELQPFTPEQVEDLVKRHELDPFDGDSADLLSLVSPHPYLVRVTLYHLARRSTSPQELVQTAAGDRGIYRDFLHQLWWQLQQHPDLVAAFDLVVASPDPVELEPLQGYQLHGLGLVHWHGTRVTPRCELFRQYFRRLVARTSN